MVTALYLLIAATALLVVAGCILLFERTEDGGVDLIGWLRADESWAWRLTYTPRRPDEVDLRWNAFRMVILEDGLHAGSVLMASCPAGALILGIWKRNA